MHFPNLDYDTQMHHAFILRMLQDYMGTSLAPVTLILVCSTNFKQVTRSDYLEYQCKNVQRWYGNRDRNNHRMRKAEL